ncbi:hypothetical protein DdX_16048 [Ditylenchus destructor]|uniref:Uncharacterized protein n=1 Tax=Ditylenchus destructor TaxID=166010 RepID=A0AAD4QU94_9BILA|nr:hypothetical protein DdX_16048 [Ditylenchus destructor]
MIRKISQQYAQVGHRLLTSNPCAALSARSIHDEQGKKGNVQGKTNLEAEAMKADGAKHVTFTEKHIHQEDIVDGKVHIENKDVFKTEVEQDIHEAHQTDYSGKLWDAGPVKMTEQQISEELIPGETDTKLPPAWEEDLNHPSVKGEGGDRVYYESKHLHDLTKHNEKQMKQKFEKGQK